MARQSPYQKSTGVETLDEPLRDDTDGVSHRCRGHSAIVSTFNTLEKLTIERVCPNLSTFPNRKSSGFSTL